MTNKDKAKKFIEKYEIKTVANLRRILETYHFSTGQQQSVITQHYSAEEYECFRWMYGKWMNGRIGALKKLFYLDFPFLISNGAWAGTITEIPVFITEVDLSKDVPEKKIEEGFETLKYLKEVEDFYRANSNTHNSLRYKVSPKTEIDTNKIVDDAFKSIKEKQITDQLEITKEDIKLSQCQVNNNSQNEVWKTAEECFGVKHSEGKLNYEFDWEFLEAAAKRMSKNKDKYPPYNWKKNINIEDLKQAINRHHIEVMKGNYNDGDEKLGHIIAYFCNSMMLWYQLKNS